MLIDQETTSLGKLTVYYSTNAIRLDIDRIKSILVMKAHLFQPARRIKFEIDADKFSGQVGTAKYAAIVSPPRLDIKVQFKAVDKTSGLPSKRFVYSPSREQAKRTCLKSAQYWISTVPIDTRAAHVIEKVCNVPIIDGLPLEFDVVTENGYNTKELRTRYSAMRYFDAKTFDVPTGFRSLPTSFEYWNTAIGAVENRDNLLELLSPSKSN